MASRFHGAKNLLPRERLPNFLALVTAVLVTVVVLALSFDARQLARLGYAGIFIANLLGSATVILPAPTIIAAFVGGFFLNPIWTGLLAGVGSGLGEINGYLAGYGGKAAIENRDFYERVRPWIARHGLVTLFVLAALPNPLFDMAGITAGAMGFPFFKFLVATCAGKTTKGLMLAFLGAGASGLLGPLLG